MAARRSLGGGRVLGSGKNLAPPTPAKPPARPIAQVNATGLLSPSESSVSLDSQTSSLPITNDNENITSRVVLHDHSSSQAAAAAASSRLMCPICNEEMVTLLQLNRHLDDNHGDIEEVEQEEAKNWFEQQVKKAKKFQPLQILNQKLRGLEAFELNNDAQLNLTGAGSPARNGRGASPAPAVSVVPATATSGAVADPEDIINQSHWQRATGNDACSDPICGKRLGSANGQVNCRHCGRLFCDEHTMYQMKLSRSAKHEPVRGYWYRVCETCYKTRDGYNDHKSHERDHTEYFKATRRKHVDKLYLETSKLETRLTRLTQLLADPPPPDPEQRTLWSVVSGDKNHLRTLEQAIVPWEDDQLVKECPYCQQPFSQYVLRRHHCRICGKVVCGDPNTGCSAAIALDVAKGRDKVNVLVRMCKDCSRTIFSKADFARELATITPDQRAYSNLVRFEHGIRLLTPKFQKLLQTLQDPANPPTPAQLAEASKVRKRLTDAFGQYDVASRRIRDLPTDSPTQERLQKAIHHLATNFLHIHMLPLKSIPKILKHANPGGNPMSQPRTGPGPGALSLSHQSRIADVNPRPESSRTSSASSAAMTALEAEERDLRERLIVLEEQQFFVSEMIADANQRRKFDEVASLAGNKEDLGREIDQIQAQLQQMDFAGAYAGEQRISK